MSQLPATGRGDHKRGPGVLADLIAGKWTSQAISVAAELGVADILKDGPRSALEIADAVGVSEDGVYRLLRALASVGIFSTVAPRRFALTPLGEYLRRDVPGSLRAWARFMGHDLTWRPWGRLAYSVRTGVLPSFSSGKEWLNAALSSPATFSSRSLPGATLTS